MWRIVRFIAFAVGPIWSITQLVTVLSNVPGTDVIGGTIDIATFVLLVHGLVVATWLALVVEFVRDRRESRLSTSVRPSVPTSTLRRCAVWMLGAGTVASGVWGHQIHTPAQASIPIGEAVNPIVAGSILTQILARRREQIRMGISPDRMTDDEMAMVGRLVRGADAAADVQPAASILVTTDDCDRILSAVERPERADTDPTFEPWEVKVQMFGYPMVVGVRGGVAEFRKKKALELLVWLVLNRDRTRRSAARTSLWEFAISDSTFSTVISDMRRALSGLGGPQSHQQWVPPTYSDVIPLAPTIVSDHELLRQAHRRFLNDFIHSTELTNAVAEIRDVPFAGANYLWADLDGSTTRLVISALDACRDLATWALEQGRRSELDVAVSAALRVMPGCEEFLDIQNLYLSTSYSYRRGARR